MNRQPLHTWTPTLHSPALSQRASTSVWLKMECYQPTASFKIRGIGRLCQHAVDNRYHHFVASSGGNAGLAVAYAGRLLDIETTIFIPKTSVPVFIEAIEAQGANICVEGDVWDDTNQIALTYAKQAGAAFIPPFDHPLIWSGHSTLIDEVAEGGLRPDAIVVAVGGGGLACGVLQGMHRWGWDDVPLFTAEPEGAASFAESVKQQEHITLSTIDTIATSLGAKRVTDELWRWQARHTITPFVVSDAQAVDAIIQFREHQRVLVEPSAGAALSLVYHQPHLFQDYRNILVIVCGGVGVSSDLITQWSQQP